MIMPTLFVLGVALIREGIEDYYRYCSDKKSNQQPVIKLTHQGPQEITSADIAVGDFLKI